jgi:hypothetical protein
MFEHLLQALPPEVEQWGRDHNAFTRARKIKTPAQLLRMVFLYCGLDKSLRDVAGEMTLLVARLTDASVCERLAACGPWLHAVLADMLETTALPPSPAGWRLLVVDGRQVEAPGATGTDYRLHVCRDVTHMQFVHIVLTDKHTGESCAHLPLGRGELVLAERHDAPADALVETVTPQVDVLLRMSAQRLPVYQPDGTRLDLPMALQEQSCDTLCTWTVRGQSPRHQRVVSGYVHAYRLDDEAAKRARQRVRERRKKKGHTPKATTLLLAGGASCLRP